MHRQWAVPLMVLSFDEWTGGEFVSMKEGQDGNWM